MYTTACEPCRKARIKCIRPSRGQDVAETCERCHATGATCETVKRRVGRQPGVKNKKRRVLSTVDTRVGDGEHLPIPLHTLASEADRPEGESLDPPHWQRPPPNSSDILDQHAEWVSKIQDPSARQSIAARLDSLFTVQAEVPGAADEPLAFAGRIDMARPDVAPENDVISLKIISLKEAKRMFDLFMELVSNGSMFFDPRLHTLEYVRRSSSFLLSVILAVASTYTRICASASLHSQLMAHAERLEVFVHRNNFKSIEICQALCLLSAWSEVPSVLSRDKAWTYVSRAVALAVELRLDSPLPYCVECDPAYSSSNHDLLVRNAHRIWLQLFIYDRNHAMVAGRPSLLPESSVTSRSNLAIWGRHELAAPQDAPNCASVLLRVIIHQLGHDTAGLDDFEEQRATIERGVSEWRTAWATEIKSTHEYEIIARFGMFVLVLTILRRRLHLGQDDAACRSTCETYAFEVVCTALNHYKSCSGLLNMATFDTSMVAFSAIYVVQAIKDPSDWSLFRLATLQELVAELKLQAQARHPGHSEDRLTVVDAMSRQLSRAIKHILSRIRPSIPASQPRDSLNPTHGAVFQQPQADLDLNVFNNTTMQWSLPDTSYSLPELAVPMFDFNQIASFFGD